MRVPLVRLRVVVFSGAILALAACAQVLGDFTVGSAGSSDGGNTLPSTDGAAEASSVAPDGAANNDGGGANDDGGQEAGSPDAATQTDAPPEACVVETTSDSTGIFVSSGGAATSCGTRAAPCGSISAGLTVLAADEDAGKSVLYVSGGTYVESLTLASGVSIEGGWYVASTGDWTRGCSTNATTIIQAPSTSNMTVLATGGSSTVNTVTIESKATPNAGESLYGVFVTGASTELALLNVTVNVSAGGNGLAGVAGAAAPPAAACSTAGTGAAGGAATPGTAATAGAFTATGYVPSNGGGAGTGNAGSNGMVSAPESNPCINAGHTCTVVNTGMRICSYVSSTVQSGGAGVPGCGGNGGGGGTGGGGGGSSIGVFAAGSTVTLTGGSVQSGAGGTGGNGGSGAAGSLGTAGSTGATYFDCGECGFNSANACVQTDENLTGGVGGPGGNGSAGGVGGAGAGGSSYAIYAQGTASVSVSAATMLMPGSAGAGGTSNGVGAAGQAAARGP